MIIILLGIVAVAVVMVVDTWLLMWLTNTLTDVGYLPHSLDFSQALHVVFVLTVVTILSGFVKGFFGD